MIITHGCHYKQIQSVIILLIHPCLDEELELKYKQTMGTRTPYSININSRNCTQNLVYNLNNYHNSITIMT